MIKFRYVYLSPGRVFICSLAYLRSVFLLYIFIIASSSLFLFFPSVLFLSIIDLSYFWLPFLFSLCMSFLSIRRQNHFCMAWLLALCGTSNDRSYDSLYNSRLCRLQLYCSLQIVALPCAYKSQMQHCHALLVCTVSICTLELDK